MSLTSVWDGSDGAFCEAAIPSRRWRFTNESEIINMSTPSGYVRNLASSLTVRGPRAVLWCGSPLGPDGVDTHSGFRGGIFMPRWPLTIEERFWSKLDRATTPDGCWTWTGRTRSRYGRIGIGQREYNAHRLAYEIQVGPVPDGHNVLHRCDNPPCVRGDHLFTGTQADNVHDMGTKGRARKATGDRHWLHVHPERAQRGEAINTAKLTESQVKEIRERYANRHEVHTSQEKLAHEYGVKQTTISHIIRGDSWSHIA